MIILQIFTGFNENLQFIIKKNDIMHINMCYLTTISHVQVCNQHISAANHGRKDGLAYLLGFDSMDSSLVVKVPYVNSNPL